MIDARTSSAVVAASGRQAPCSPVSHSGAVDRGAPEVAAHVEALVVAVQHEHGAALQPRLPVQLAQQQHGACRAGAGRTSGLGLGKINPWTPKAVSSAALHLDVHACGAGG